MRKRLLLLSMIAFGLAACNKNTTSNNTRPEILRAEPTTLTLSVARSNLSAAVIGNKLVVAGGYDNSNSSDAIDVFTIGADGKLIQSTENLTLSVARGDLSAAIIGNKLVVAGGYNSNNSSSSNAVDVFTLNSNGELIQSSTENLTLSVARSDLSAAVIGNKLVVAGGYNTTSGSSDAVDVFTIGADGKLIQSTERLTLSVARGDLSAAIIGNKLVVAGGYNSNSSYSNAIDVFTIASDGKLIKSAERLTLSVARSGLSAAVIGNKLVVAGGYDNSNSSDVIDVFTIGADGKLIKSAESLTLSVARRDLSAAVIGNKLVVAGGYKGTKKSNAIDIFTLSK